MIWSDPIGNSGILEDIVRGLRQPMTSQGDIGHWKWTDLLRRANDCMREICEVTECLKTLDTSNISVSGQAQYDKPAQCQRICRVAYGNRKLDGILMAQLDRVSNPDDPWQNLNASSAFPVSEYIEYLTSYLILFPIPADSGTVISIEFIVQPTQLALPADIPFNANPNLYSFHQLITFGVVARCLAEEKDGYYSYWENKFNQGMERLKDYVRKMPDTQMTMLLDGYGRRRRNTSWRG